MGEVTGIEWCHHTFNPWIGCTKVSAGCRNCYAEVDNPARISRGRGLELWGVDAARKGKAESGWAEPLKWFRAAAKAGERRRVFCASQGDVFEDRRDLDVHRERLWSVIDETRIGWGDGVRFPVIGGLDWLLLTKRPEAILRLIPRHWGGVGPCGGCGAAQDVDCASWCASRGVDQRAMPANVWIGTSVEDQAAADERIPHLLRVPARVRFLSLEPLLGPVDLYSALRGGCGECGANPASWVNDGHDMCCPECLGAQRREQPRIHWLIIGGESGGSARPCDLAWIRDLRDQGRAAGVSVFVKQLGARAQDPINSIAGPELFVPGEAAPIVAGRLLHPKGGDPAEWPADLRVREFPQ